MIIKESASSQRSIWTGAGILVVGVLIGALAPVGRWATDAKAVLVEDAEPALESGTKDLEGFLDRAPGTPAPADNDLATLTINVTPEAGRVLQRVRDTGLARGIIVQTEEDTVPARLEFGGREAKADVRIKGDWIDHIDTNKWSLRIKLKSDTLLGMRVFSIQHPKTRGWLWEWFVLAAMRREGVLAPRATYVNVVINGNPAGVYYLEEHFSKELLESQGRREGPIVKWDESAVWSTRLQAHDVASKNVDLPGPLSARRTTRLGGTFSSAFGEKRLSSTESLSRSLFGAIEQMDALKAKVLATDSFLARLRQLEELTEVEELAVDNIIDADRTARAHALASLFQLSHSLTWTNMRFYHDPVQNRLEPIMFDNMATLPGSQNPVMIGSRDGVIRAFATSRAYYNGVFRYLGRICAPDYVDALYDDLGDELESYERALLAEYPVPRNNRIASMMQRLRAQQIFLRNTIYPAASMHVRGFYEVAASAQTPVEGQLEIEAWTLTRTPIVLEGFRFPNGAFVPALPNLVDERSRVSQEGEAGVVLPPDGRPITFRFPMDSRLANLETVQQLKQAALESAAPGEGLQLDLEAVYRPIATEVQESRPISLRRRESDWIREGGRPAAPTLAHALERHPFLEFDPIKSQLIIQRGTWQVDGDLVIPSGISLHCAGGARLQFAEDAVFLTDSPLHLTGVTFEPVRGAQRWRGIVVIGANGRSELENVIVRKTDAVARGGWIVTGGITFYRSPLTMRNCTIEGTLAEDGLNVFGTDLLMERVTFTACASDSFDGDFISGTIRNCLFQDGLADGVDVSGSDIDVINCRFLNMGDKAVSAGEDSTVRISGGVADGVSIGIAAKDGSDVDAEGMQIRAARNYALAAFVKKSAFGPCQLRTHELLIEGSGLGVFIAETGCLLEIDGVAQPTQELDVKQLYEDKILGQ